MPKLIKQAITLKDSKQRGRLSFLVFSFFYLGTITIFYGQSKKLTFYHLTQAEGLTQSINAYILHDSYGYVWLSSIDGLNRFDGIHVKAYREVPGDSTSLSGKNIYSSLFEDAEGNIWFTTLKGLQVYRRATDSFQKVPVHQYLESDSISSIKLIHLDKEQNLWIKAGRHLLIFNLETYQPRSLFPASGIDGFVRPIKDSSTFWLFTHNRGRKAGFHVHKIGCDSLQLIDQKEYLVDGRAGYVYDLVFEKNQYWLGTSEGFFEYLPQEDHLIPISTQIGKVRSIELFLSKYLLISSERGLFIFDKDAREFIHQYRNDPTSIFSIASDTPHDLYLDNQNNLWISIWGQGVDYTNLIKPKFKTLTLYGRYNSNRDVLFEPRSILEDRKNRIWVGNAQNGLMVLNPQMQVISSLCDSTIGVRQFFQTFDGLVWLVSSDKKIHIYNHQDQVQQILDLNIFSSNSVGRLFQLFDGRILMTGYSQSGIYEIKQDKEGLYYIMEVLESEGLLKATYDRIFQLNDGRILLSHNNEKVSVFDYENSVFHLDTILHVAAEVKAFLEDEKGIIWLGSTAGLIALNPNDFEIKLYAEKDGLLNPYIYGILADKQNRLWMSTNKGIFSFEKENAIFKEYNISQGLQWFEFNADSYLKTHNNELWFGGVKGCNIFKPNEIEDMPENARLNVVSLEINDEPYPLGKDLNRIDSLQLSYFQNTFGFTFVSSEYSDPKSCKVRFRLQNEKGKHYDKNWIIKNNQQAIARYTKVNPGRYNLLVQASNSDGVWSTNVHSIYIEIEPPFWLQTWFIITCLLAIGAIIWFSTSVYIQNKLRLQKLTIREQKIELEKQSALQIERKRIARDMHDDLGTGLTRIRQTASQAKKKTSEFLELNYSLSQMEGIAEGLIENMQGIIWAMDGDQSQLDELVAYIRRYLTDLFEEADIDYKISSYEEWPNKVVSTEIKRSIFLAIKEAGHNILKHSNATLVSMDFNWKNNLIIAIEDDGIGIKQEGSEKAGNGLTNMSRRMKDVGGEFYQEMVEPQGLRLTFHIPI